MDIDLDDLSLDELVQLRGQVVAQIARRTILDETPREVAGLASRYTAAGGDPAALLDALQVSTTDTIDQRHPDLGKVD